MKSISNEERSLKRYLKNHISLNTETMVKFLITGTVALSLTACGGGGGGGNLTNPIPPVVGPEEPKPEPPQPPVVGPEEPKPEPPQPPIKPEEVVENVNKTNETHEISNKNITVQGSIKGDGNTSNFVGIKAINSTVDSKATIDIVGEGAIGLYGTTSGVRTAILPEVTNSGNISITGKNAIGLKVDNGVKGINNGSIKINGSGVGIEAKDSKVLNNGKVELISEIKETKMIEEGVELTQRESLPVVGIFGNNSTLENSQQGVIILTGDGAGILAVNNSKANNLGKIILKDQENFEERVFFNTVTGKFEIGRSNYTTRPVGMEAINSEIVNSNLIQIDGSGYGMVGNNGSTIVNNGRIEILRAVDVYNAGILVDNKMQQNSSSVLNNGEIIMGIKDDGYMLTGIHGGVSGVIENSKTGKIELNGGIKTYVRGMIGGEIINNGVLKLTGGTLEGLSGTNVKNQGNLFLIGNENEEIVSAIVGKNLLNDSTGKIDISGLGELYGMRGDKYNNEQVVNKGQIIGNGSNIYGIEGNNVINEGSILLTSTDNAEGINDIEHDWNAGITQNVNISNSGILEIEASTYAKGIAAYQGDKVEITNSGKILVNSTGQYASGEGVGIDVRGNSGAIINGSTGVIRVLSQNTAHGIRSVGVEVINHGEINVEGNKDNNKWWISSGIKVENTKATNHGTINVDGKGSYGMYATNGAVAENSETGIINVSATAEGGMIASGQNSKVVNNGVINIASRDGLDELNKESIALKAENGGSIENTGTINIDGNLNLGTSSKGKYVIGTTKDGTYGKISAKNVSIDGDVVVSTEITKNEYKNEYTMQNVVDAENIVLGDSFNFTSNSLLYDANSVTDIWGNLDATLTRNNKTLADFTNGYLTSVANIFGKYQTEETFKSLSVDAKEVINAIDTSSKNAIDNSLNSLTPTIYSNLGRQLLETSETFKEQDMLAINSLENNTYNFTFIGEYKDVDSRNNIEGYKSKLSGFVGAMNFGDETFGTIGYGYNAIDYKENGKGNIQTIHLGLNKFVKYQKVDFKLGLGGEYNFHENKRDIDLLNRRAESKFNSYGVRATGEVSKIIGEEMFVKPYLGLDLAYMKYDSFTESDAKSLNATIESENYVSVLPKIGLLVGEKVGKLDVFAKAEYSYELGNMDKEQQFSYEGFNGKGNLPKDTLESGTVGLEAGINYGMNNFTLGGSIGKNFGRRDNGFAKLSLGYRF